MNSEEHSHQDPARQNEQQPKTQDRKKRKTFVTENPMAAQQQHPRPRRQNPTALTAAPPTPANNVQQGNDVPNHVQVLALKWVRSDFQMDNLYDKICEVFKTLRYNVTMYDIPMQNSENKVKEVVTEFLPHHNTTSEDLYIIYYIGHGGESTGGGLKFSSHNKKTGRDVKVLLQQQTGNLDDDCAHDELKNFIEGLQGALYSLCKDSEATSSVKLSKVLKLPQANLALILDCCHAATAFNGVVLGNAQNMPNGPYIHHALAASIVDGKTWGGGFSQSLCGFLIEQKEAGVSKVSLTTISNEITAKLQALQRNKRSTDRKPHHATVTRHPSTQRDKNMYLPLDRKE